MSLDVNVLKELSSDSVVVIETNEFRLMVLNDPLLSHWTDCKKLQYWKTIFLTILKDSDYVPIADYLINDPFLTNHDRSVIHQLSMKYAPVITRYYGFLSRCVSAWEVQNVKWAGSALALGYQRCW